MLAVRHDDEVLLILFAINPLFVDIRIVSSLSKKSFICEQLNDCKY